MLVDQLVAGHAEVGLEHVRLEGEAPTLSRQVDLIQKLFVGHWHLTSYQEVKVSHVRACVDLNAVVKKLIDNDIHWHTFALLLHSLCSDCMISALNIGRTCMPVQY